jgi:3-phosphoshikimate 1-carboxyvinyltransferase
MGASIAPSSDGLLVGGPLRVASGREVALDAGESGTAARFLAALCAAVPGRFLLTGAGRLRERPMEELLVALRSAGADVRCTGKPGHLPLAIAGGALSPGRVNVDASRSSQFLSALLLAAAAIGELEVTASAAVASAPYVAVTLESLRAFGHEVGVGPDGSIRVVAGLSPPPRYEVPGDYSSAVPLLAAAGIVGGEVTVEGLSWPSTQADALALPVMERMGIAIEKAGGRVRARAAAGKLSAVTVEAGGFPDAVPSLAALACLASGVSRFGGVAHLRWKESDRIASVKALLAAAGARAREEDGDLLVEGPPDRRPGARVLPTSGDHRIAMAAALLSLARPGCLIESPGCVAKSYPGFFRDLETLVRR